MTIHQRIDEALAQIKHGWCSHQKADDLASCVMAMGGGNILEIGLFAGRSFFPMAMAVRHCGIGKAIGIDPFDAEISAESEEGANKEWWKGIDHHYVENAFREKLWELQLQEWTVIHKSKSDDVEPPENISVLHVDGGHRDEALRDTVRFAGNVVMGGFCILDDVTWEGGAVSKSANWLTVVGFVERRRVVGIEKHTGMKDDYAIYQRIK